MADHNQKVEVNSNAEIIQFTLPVTAIQAVYDTRSFYLAEVVSLGYLYANSEFPDLPVEFEANRLQERAVIEERNL